MLTCAHCRCIIRYGLIDLSSPHAASGIESIADAVTHTKFMGTDLASDEVVLMKILQVLRTILLTPVGACMSNEAVCELMQTCFKICFEMRLSERLRRCTYLFVKKTRGTAEF